MSTAEAENKEIVRRYPVEVISGGDLDVIDEVFAEDYVQHNAAGSEPLHGPDEVRENASRLRTAFPNVNCGIEALIADGDTVVRRDRATGTHQGEFMGIQPTGREIVAEGIHIHRIEDGQIVETWAQSDVMGVMLQLGVVEPAGE